MAENDRQLKPTQRAYTLRLHGLDKTDHSWRNAIWATHEAVNNGAKVFGDWLLTLRGGLDHTLAEELRFDADSVEGRKLIESTLKQLTKAKTNEGVDPTERDAAAEIERRRHARIRDRRILLALSWLSVESSPKQNDRHDKFVIGRGNDNKVERNEKVLTALRNILAKRGVTRLDIDSWMEDCEPSLSASIRDDAVWMNRSDIFDSAQEEMGPSLTREEVWDLLEPFFGNPESYLAPLNPPDDSNDDVPAEEDKAKDLVQKAGNWLSSRFGTGKGANFSEMTKIYDAMASWAGKAGDTTLFASGSQALHSLADSLVAFSPETKDADGLLRLISGPGYKSATRNIIKAWESKDEMISLADLTELKTIASEDRDKCKSNTGGKGRRPWSDRILQKVESACGFTYLQNGPARHCEFAVMLDHAARRVSITHTWIKRAESEREKFKVEAAKIEKVPADAKLWLYRFCEDRSKSSGAIDAYRIRRGATHGWKEVVARWSSPSCLTPDDRVAAARDVQADPDIDKFGDIQLFEALAADNAAVVWRVNGEPTPQPLIDYAVATDALFKQTRFKVPAYRHPDPLSHPVFCDFGNSRWDIHFAVHDAASKLMDARASVARREKELEKAKERVAKAKTAENRADAELKLDQAERDLSKGRDQVAWMESRHALSLGLWDGKQVDDSIPLRWSCKRLTKDLGLQASPSSSLAVKVTRADRLGRAAAGADETSPVTILSVFNQADWNGRLQAPRSQLDEIARRVKDHGWDARAQRMRDHIHWLVSFSAKLQPAGPWIDYIAQFPEDAPAKPFVSRNGEYAVKHATNNARSGHAKLILCRLPGLRVLSVDLGHRYAAACAVWATLSSEGISAEIAGRTVLAGGTGPDDLYLHTRSTDQHGNVRSTIYRRIGSDTLPEGSRHPAPWARLDRQFLIKLPGEEQPARRASDAEITAVKQIEAELGWQRNPENALPNQVDELMAEAVRTIRLALRRLGDAARIAYAFMPGSERHTLGGGRSTHTSETRKAALLDALVRWYEMRGGTPTARWIDPVADRHWNDAIRPKLSVELPTLGEDATIHDRKKHRAELEKALDPIAGELARHGESGIPALYNLWKERWEKDSAAWTPRLRWIREWLLPKGLRSRRCDTEEMAAARKAGRAAARHVGGLSLDRVTAIRELYQFQKAYHYRPHPDDPRAGVKLVEEESAKGWKFGDRALQAMERMRDQRVKQLASRIAGSALGLGGHWKQVDTGRKNGDGTTRMKWIWTEDSTAKYHPCHAIVIENLTNYRPEETRTRRENRQLMSWSSSKVKKYLSEACELHGLHLREVQAGYTSRQDSRTGAPGIRCADVPVIDFMTKPWWRRQAKLAQEKADKGDARERWLVAIEKRWSSQSDPERKAAPAIRIPVNGGELFVSADSRSPAAKGLQADLNAAANIGLKALLDPDWPGKWWFIPCESATHKPHADKTKGSSAIPPNLSLIPEPKSDSEAPHRPTSQKHGRSGARKKERAIVNLWRDVSSSPIDERSSWQVAAEYWNNVRSRVVSLLHRAQTFRDDPPIEPLETPW